MRPALALLVFGATLSAPPAFAQDDDAAIREVIETAYVDAVFVARDEAAVRAGFHPDFVLAVLMDDGEILVVTLDEWLARLELDGTPSGDEVRHEIERVDVTGDTAVVKALLWIDGEHVYTDYMGLYRLPAGWRIVTKVFHGHD